MRTDTVDNWMDYDNSTNLFIEQVYQKNSLFKTSVDLIMEGSKWEYLIEGFSGKPESWYQINTSTERKRQMKRVIKKVNEESSSKAPLKTEIIWTVQGLQT